VQSPGLLLRGKEALPSVRNKETVIITEQLSIIREVAESNVRISFVLFLSLELTHQHLSLLSAQAEQQSGRGVYVYFYVRITHSRI
jgi:hypothetical protein